MTELGEETAEGKVKISRSATRAKGYLVIDHGDEIRADIKMSHEQIQKQIEHLQWEVTLIWRALQGIMILFVPLIVSWIGFFILRLYFSEAWEGLWVALNSTIMTGCLALFITPVHDSLDKLSNALNAFDDLKTEALMEHILPEDIGFGDAGKDDLLITSSDEDEKSEHEISVDGVENTNNNDTI